MRDPNGPATRKQVRYATDLGLEVPEGITKREISKLIDDALEDRQPSEAQLKFASELGLTIPEGATFDDVSDMLDTATRNQAIAIMQANPCLRAGKRIMYEECPYEILFAGRRGGRSVVQLRAICAKPELPSYKDREVAIYVLAGAVEATREEVQRFRIA